MVIEFRGADQLSKKRKRWGGLWIWNRILAPIMKDINHVTVSR